jgi:hypothetical protein
MHMRNGDERWQRAPEIQHLRDPRAVHPCARRKLFEDIVTHIFQRVEDGFDRCGFGDVSREAEVWEGPVFEV